MRLALSIITMHTQVAKDLVNEYNAYLRAYENAGKGVEAAEGNLYKLQRAQEVLDHLQMVLPDDIMPYKNMRYSQYTLYFLDAANTYDEISKAYANASEKYPSIKGKFDGDKAAAAAHHVRSIILGHVVDELNFIENSKNIDKVRKAHEDNLEMIYQLILPELSECNGEEMSKLNVAATCTAYFVEAKKHLEALEEDMQQISQILDDYERMNFPSAEVDGKQVWVGLPANVPAVAERFASDRGAIENRYKYVHKPSSIYASSLYTDMCMLRSLSKTNAPIAKEAESLVKRFDKLQQQVDEAWELVKRVK